MLKLEIDGQDYAGWTEARISRSIALIAGTFSLSFTNAFVDKLPRIQTGLSCKIFKDDELQMTGFIDSVDISFDKKAVTLTVNGRDITGDLADCSTQGDASEWQGLVFEKLVAEVVNPFGIKVITKQGFKGTKIETVSYDQGTAVFELIKKHAEKQEALVFPSKEGDLIIGTTGTEFLDFALIEGENVLTATGSYDASDLFSDYIIKGSKDPSPLESDERLSTQSQSIFKDKLIKRTRPIIIIQEGATDNEFAKRRAAWEGKTRRANAKTFNVEVQGWHNEINVLANFQSRTLKIAGKDSEMLIESVDLSVSNDGELTVMKLVPPQAFQPTPAEFLDDTDETENYNLGDLSEFGL